MQTFLLWKKIVALGSKLLDYFLAKSLETGGIVESKLVSKDFYPLIIASNCFVHMSTFLTNSLFSEA